MLDPQLIAEYDATRRLEGQAFRAVCYAPFASMYLDSLGNVRACCQNSLFKLGNVTEQRLREIWAGERAQRLRDAMRQYDLWLGCQFCQWQIEGRKFGAVYAELFEHLRPQSPTPRWPQMIEFSISNACNLACQMCNGYASSTIRAKRDNLPPLPKCYDDAFFDDLAEFLPHLVEARFFGGEPFLAAESFRVWDLLAEQGLQPVCRVTTNATQYNARIEEVLQRLPMSFVVSLDAARADVYEAIRQGARFDEVMTNLRRFHRYTQERGAEFGIAYCHMRQNWQELADVLLLAEELDCDVSVNSVSSPAEMSLYALSRQDLAPIVAAMQRQTDALLPRLKRNAQVWLDQLARLELVVAADDQTRRKAQGLESMYGQLLHNLKVEGHSEAWSLAAPDARQVLGDWSDGGNVEELYCDAHDCIELPQDGVPEIFGISLDDLTGQVHAAVFARLQAKFGYSVREVSRDLRAYWTDRLIEFSGRSQPGATLRAITVLRFDDLGQPLGTLTLAALRPADGAPVATVR